jgi:SAM-dependent methyltransferase
MDVHMVDIRPLDADIQGLNFIQGDATELSFFKSNSIESISSLHAAEHFGLGRYGDPIDPGGHKKFMHNLQRVLEPNGRLYFSVPVGKERVEFNAHRVLSPYTVIDQFDELELVRLDGVIGGEFTQSVSPTEFENRDFACGLFEFTK